MPQSVAAPVEVREIVAADVPEAVALVRAVLAEFGLRFGDGSTTDAELEGLPASYATRGGRFWVARDAAGALIGTAGVMPLSPEEVELRKMYLAPAARGLGLGRRLLELSTAFGRSLGARRMVLDTTDKMTSAIALYERSGFVRDDAQRRASRCTRGYRLDLSLST
jgi:putative acetyltransferase